MNNLPAIQQELIDPDISARLKSRLGDKAGTFITSVLDLCGEDKNLSMCDPKLVVKEALKAAALDLPINKNLGFAYVIPYGKAPSFQMGYKGYIQLAIRTCQYKHLNAGIVYKGEHVVEDRIKGIMTIEGERISDEPIGYFCYMQLINGFEKAVSWSIEEVKAHAIKFSKSYNTKSSPWKTDFDAMALKTMILRLVPKYGPMSIDMAMAVSSERIPVKDIQEEINQNANSEVIDIPNEEINILDEEISEEEKQAIIDAEIEESNKGPGF